MKTYRLVLLIMALATLSWCAAETALAGGSYHHRGYHGYHGHSSFRVVIGGPFWAPYYPYPARYYYPYSYYPYSPYYYPYAPEIIVPAVPREYMQRPDYREPAPAQAGTWYFCQKSNAYYPYVQDCETGWQSVPSAPASGSRDTAPAAPGGSWYFCPKSNAYYPYVKDCPGGWQTTPAQPSSGPGR